MKIPSSLSLTTPNIHLRLERGSLKSDGIEKIVTKASYFPKEVIAFLISIPNLQLCCIVIKSRSMGFKKASAQYDKSSA